MPLFLSDSNSVSFSCWGMEGHVGVFDISCIFSHICDIKIFGEIWPKNSKIGPKLHFKTILLQNFPEFFVKKK
jgi:hypothetical protein